MEFQTFERNDRDDRTVNGAGWTLGVSYSAVKKSSARLPFLRVGRLPISDCASANWCIYHYHYAGVSLYFFLFLYSFSLFFFEISLVTQERRFFSLFLSLSPFSFSLSFFSFSRDDARWPTKRLMARNVPSTSANLQCASGFRFLLILLISFDLSLRARYVLLLISLRQREWNIHDNSLDRSMYMYFTRVEFNFTLNTFLVKLNCELH